MSVPLTGTYKNEDQQFTIKIDSAVSTNGDITGTYTANFSEEGPIEKKGKIGKFAWVENNQGIEGVAPFNIHFTAYIRPSGRAYCIVDKWNGAYRKDDTILLTGTRAYVNNKGEVESSLIATSTFTRVS